MLWTLPYKHPVSQFLFLRSPDLPHLAVHKKITMVITYWTLTVCQVYDANFLWMSFSSQDTSGETDLIYRLGNSGSECLSKLTSHTKDKQQGLDSNPSLPTWSGGQRQYLENIPAVEARPGQRPSFSEAWAMWCPLLALDPPYISLQKRSLLMPSASATTGFWRTTSFFWKTVSLHLLTLPPSPHKLPILPLNIINS